MESSAGCYRSRDPEHSPLYRIVSRHLETFLALQRARDRPIPGFVEDEFRSFLECGVLEYGFLRLHCEECGKDRLLAFSCKGRGFCPSCVGRRMADTAAHLVERVLPDVPIRQWVLSLPFPLRYRAAFDTALPGKILRIFVGAVFGLLKQRAREYGIPEGKCGAVTFIQRFGSALNLTPHFHVLVFDGVYAAGNGESPGFYALRAPAAPDVAAVAARVAKRVAAVLESASGESPEPEESGLAAIASASIVGRITEGANAGQRVKTAGTREGEWDVDERLEGGSSCRAMVSGFSIHAGVRIRAGQRKELERLCRYAEERAAKSGNFASARAAITAFA